MARTFLIRHSYNWPRKWYHKYQHIYALIIYFNYTLIWILVYDYIHLVEFYGKIGTNKDKTIPISMIISIFFWKIMHLFLMISDPLSSDRYCFVADFSWFCHYALDTKCNNRCDFSGESHYGRYC